VRVAHRQEAARLARMLADCGVSLVILFGSVAQGCDSFGSDIDLAAVSERARDMPFSVRIAEALARLQPTVATDLLIYTPEEWARLLDERSFIRHEVVGKGVASHGGLRLR
jgi:predicted nucleotidyltransferase